MHAYVAGATVKVLRGTPIADPYAHGGSGASDQDLDWTSPTQVGPTQIHRPIAAETVAEAPTPGAPMVLEERLTLYLDYGTDITAYDRVEVSDSPYAGIYEVDGIPAHWQNPYTGATPGTSAKLGKRIGG